MTALLDQQLASMATAELWDVYNRYADTIPTSVSPDSLGKPIRQIRKARAVCAELAARGETVDQSVFDLAFTNIIAIAKTNGIDPAEFGESWDSLGVLPWPVKGNVSIIDQSFADRKETIKWVIVDYIKANPTLAQTDLLAWAETSFDAQEYLLTQYLLQEYINNAYTSGLTPAADYASFRDWVVATPTEVLQAF